MVAIFPDYGFHSLVGKVGINPLSVFQGKYYKFPPHYLLRGAAGQLSETASINSHGFRGPEFETTKAPGLYRIRRRLGTATAIARRIHTFCRNFSRATTFTPKLSTPVFLITTPAAFSPCSRTTFWSIADLITLYAGYNDTSWPTHIGLTGRLSLWVHSHSITQLVLREMLGEFLGKVEHRVFERTIPQKLRDDEFRRDDDLVASRYSQNVRSIIRIGKSRGIAIVIKQPVTTHDGAYLSMSYEEENRRIREKFARGELLSEIETWMLKQHRLTKELERIAQEEDVPVVDNIKIVDQDRRRFASWVHLTPEANERLAEALEAVIKHQGLQAHAAEPARLAQ